MKIHINKLLVANRGEIALRIMRSAHELGIPTVAVYSRADAGSPHVEYAHEAVCIGEAPPRESYLNMAALLEAARLTGADAVHPGYGFLSENAEFAQACREAGLCFVGPSEAAIRAMGDKARAKILMGELGLPCIPGYSGPDQDPAALKARAQALGYPLMIKATAGGGGRGMRIVTAPEAFDAALASAKSEAKNAFGNDQVILERVVERPRHIEVQVLVDGHGQGIHLGERDCSVQRRSQKVIEEAPAPGMTAAMREAMTDAAVKAAKAIDYSGAGTIEFIVDASEGLRPDRFWFMEMNTRLQVEHPVTEMITGVDLVEWQLRVASGEKLPRTQEEISLSGHAFEARLYAEDAAKGFLPAIGTLHRLRFPDAAAGEASLRIETGVREGDAISPFYDPMIAKLVTYAPTRAAALAALSEALSRTEIAGSVVNTAFLAALATDPDFAAGNVDTGMIGRRQDELTAAKPVTAQHIAAAAVAASGLGVRPDAADPWAALAGYAHFQPLAKTVSLAHDGEEIKARLTVAANGNAQVEVEGASVAVPASGGRFATARWPGHVTVFSGAASHTFAVHDPFADAEAAAAGGDALRAPMPGLVKLARAAAGDSVVKGQPLLVLEAMKMEHTIAAPHDGVIEEIVPEGAQVTDGAVLVRFREEG